MLIGEVLDPLAILLVELDIETGHYHRVFIACKGVSDGDQAAVGAMEDVMFGPLDVDVGFHDGILLGAGQEAAQDGQQGEGNGFAKGVHAEIGF
jgi:hypothetical protein